MERMKVDVTVQTVIECEPFEAFAYGAQLHFVPDWCSNIVGVSWEGAPLIKVGSCVTFVAFFFHRRVQSTFEIVEVVRDERIVIRNNGRPFLMEATFVWKEVNHLRTQLTMHLRGEPTGVLGWFAALMTRQLTVACQRDVARLRRLTERTYLRADVWDRQFTPGWRISKIIGVD